MKLRARNWIWALLLSLAAVSEVGMWSRRTASVSACRRDVDVGNASSGAGRGGRELAINDGGQEQETARTIEWCSKVRPNVTLVLGIVSPRPAALKNPG